MAPTAKTHYPNVTSKKRTRTVFLASFFIAANLLSAITWSVFHSSYSKDENWSSSSLAISDVINYFLLAAPEGNNTSNDYDTKNNHIEGDRHRPATITAVSMISTANQMTEQQHIPWSSSYTTNNNTALTTTFWHPTPPRVVADDDAFPLLQPHNSARRQLLYKRIVQEFTRQGRPINTRLKRGTCVHRNVKQVSRIENANQSTIEYIACCGLGHRLSRMSAAAHVATKLKAHLYAYWRCCDEVEVFSYLFGKDPIILYKQDNQGNNNDKEDGDPRSNSTTTPQHQQAIHLQFRNDVPGFKETIRKCSCTKDKVTSDFAFYSTLRERYSKKHVVDDFVHQHFTNQTLSIAIHIRAGNGETGDFTNKNRTINDTAAFVRNTAEMIREIVAQSKVIMSSSSSPSQQQHLSPLVFIATDTPLYVDAFRKELLAGNSSTSNTSASPIPVVTLPAQIFVAEGEGVLFGVSHKVTQSGEQCQAGWDAVLQDMLVMSHADIVFGPTYSSFTQSLPLSLTLGRRRSNSRNHAHDGENKKRHHIQAPFCDVRNDKLQCYESLQQWCCTEAPLKTLTHQDVVWTWREIMLL